MRPGLLLLSAVVAAAIGSFASAPGAQESASVWDGIYTEAQAERGSVLYATGCARCHGPDLKGGEMAPGIAGGDFTWAWNGLSVGQLFERLRMSMPLDEPDRMTPQQKADVLAYMLKMNEFPPGKTELTNKTELLNAIRFDAIKR